MYWEMYIKELKIMADEKIQLLNIETVNKETRPRLFEMISIAGGDAYILSREVLSDAPDDEKLLVLVMGDGNLLLIEDTPKSADGEADEIYKAMLIDDTARENIAKILAPAGRPRKESTGRPKVYHEDMAEEIFKDNYKNNLSIKKISFKRNMSPTTVQKLLNEYRAGLADKILNGEDVMIIDNDAEHKLKILEWAISKSKGEKRRNYEQYYFKMINS